MAKKNKQKNKQENQLQTVKEEKSPEMLVLEKEIEQLKNDLSKLHKDEAELNEQKKLVERELNKVQIEQDQQTQKVDKLKKSAFEVREAIRKIDELKLAISTEIEDESLLALVQASNKPKTKNEENDDKALAVAARYKLNDLIFYTEDKNLRNKATSVGIKTA